MDIRYFPFVPYLKRPFCLLYHSLLLSPRCAAPPTSVTAERVTLRPRNKIKRQAAGSSSKRHSKRFETDWKEIVEGEAVKRHSINWCVGGIIFCNSDIWTTLLLTWFVWSQLLYHTTKQVGCRSPLPPTERVIPDFIIGVTRGVTWTYAHWFGDVLVLALPVLLIIYRLHGSITTTRSSLCGCDRTSVQTKAAFGVNFSWAFPS